MILVLQQPYGIIPMENQVCNCIWLHLNQVSLLDLASTFDTNNLTIGRNSLKINGATADLIIDVEDSAIQLVYTGATYGWKLTSNN